MPISTRNLKQLPDVEGLRRLMQSLAVLDAILCPEWEDRYYSFDSRWSKTEQMGSMRNGSGDEFFALFNQAGCFLKGFAHEYPMSPYARRPNKLWPGLLDRVPVEFAACLKEPAFSMEATTFCIWRLHTDTAWQRGEIEFPDHPDPDGSLFLLELLAGKPTKYQRWAKDYYEQSVPIVAVRHIYAHSPLTSAIVESLNVDVDWPDLTADIKEIGYPGSLKR